MSKETFTEAYQKVLRNINEDISIERGAKEVIAKATGRDSEILTKIGKKLLHIEQMEREIKEMKKQLKDEIRNEKVFEIFDQAEDELKTRKIETLSLLIVISKKPKPRESYSYKSVIEELVSLFPEIEQKYSELLEKYKTVTELDPTVSVTPYFKESIGRKTLNLITSLKSWFSKSIESWAAKFDQKLSRIRRRILDMTDAE